jgi:hypothetical protein
MYAKIVVADLELEIVAKGDGSDVHTATLTDSHVGTTKVVDLPDESTAGDVAAGLAMSDGPGEVYCQYFETDDDVIDSEFEEVLDTEG